MPIIAFLCLGLFLCPACWMDAISGSGRVESQLFSLKGFNKIEAGSAFEVEIVKAEEFSVETRMDDNLKDYVEVEKRGDVLYVGKKSGKNVSFRHCTLQAKISMPDLESLDLLGAARARLSGFESERLFLKLSGAAKLSGSINVKQLAAELDLSGMAQKVTLDSSGASKADLVSLESVDMALELKGASEAHVLVTGKLEVSASGASTIRYKGNPTLGLVRTSGASRLKQL